jgi:hypothetical protein
MTKRFESRPSLLCNYLALFMATPSFRRDLAFDIGYDICARCASGRRRGKAPWSRAVLHNGRPPYRPDYFDSGGPAKVATLLPVPAPGAYSKAAREYSLSRLLTRLSPSRPTLALSPDRVPHRVGARASVSFSPAIPSSAFVVPEFWLRYPLLIPHNSSIYQYCKW